MEANELRIGNWVKLKNSEIESTISEIVQTKKDYMVGLFGNFVRNQLNGIEPIPITEDRLKKSEVYYNHAFEFWQIVLGSGMVLFIEEKEEGWILRTSKNIRVKIEYIHQLQNIYFSLTGKELRIV